jgi:type IX secretion system PorP/SprF family membrane protein
MRLIKTLLLFLATFAFVTHIQGQDLHNSLFYMNPLHINPAFTGAYEGTYRIGGIYRDQTRSVVTNAYSTPSFFIDAPVVMVGKRHWVGVGGLMFQDQSGTGKLKTTSFQLSGAFHLALDKKSNNVLTLGVQWGKVQRSLKNAAGLEFADYLEQVQSGVASPSTDDEVVGQTGGTGGPSGGKSEPQKDYTDINAGLLFSSKVSKTTNYNIGFSVRHITTPRYDFQSTVEELPLRITAHAQLNTPLTGKWSLTPEVYYTNIDPASQFQVHGWAGYMLNPEKNIKLNFGLGYRSLDAGQVLFGMDYGSLKAALAYDVTLSSLNEANNYKGGFEIAVYYIGKIYKKPVVKPVIIGPHL